MKKVLHLLDEHFEEWLLTLFLGLMAVIMLLQVIMRYVFKTALTWPEEVCRYLYIWCCFVGVSYCISRGSELKVDLTERLFKGKAKKAYRCILQLISVVLYAYFFYLSLPLVQQLISTGQTSSAAQIPMWLVYLSLPISMALAVFRAVQQVIVIWKKAPDTETIKEEKV